MKFEMQITAFLLSEAEFLDFFPFLIRPYARGGIANSPTCSTLSFTSQHFGKLVINELIIRNSLINSIDDSYSASQVSRLRLKL